MNEHFFRNLLKVVVSYALYCTGILHVLTNLFVRRGLLIFNYHGFSTFTNDYWDFGSLYASGYGRNFEKQVRYYEKRFHKLTDFDLSRPFGKQPAYFLTFDDGYRDNYEIALPVLVKHAIPSIFFLATAAIGTDRVLWYDAVRRRYESKSPGGRRAAASWKRRCKDELERIKNNAGKDGQWMMRVLPDTSPRLMMTWEEVRRAKEAGVLIGAHTHTHPILASLPADSQRDEILTSIEMIKQKMGRTPEFFSYAGGESTSFDVETVRILKNAGIRFAVTTEDGINDPTNAAPYLLKRIGMNPSDPVPVVALKIALIGLRTGPGFLRLKKRIAGAWLSFRQYGPWNSAKRVLKAAARFVGLHIETYWVLVRDLRSPDEAPPSPQRLVVKPLDYEDFEKSAFFGEFSPEKRDLLKWRFSRQEYRAFGGELNGELIYMTWINTNVLRIEAIQYERKLEPGEGVLLDSRTLPKARGRGIHVYMSWYRLMKLKEEGVVKAFVAVMTENRPALKAQFSIGFQRLEKLTRLKWGRLDRLYRTRSPARSYRDQPGSPHALI